MLTIFLKKQIGLNRKLFSCVCAHVKASKLAIMKVFYVLWQQLKINTACKVNVTSICTN